MLPLCPTCDRVDALLLDRSRVPILRQEDLFDPKNAHLYPYDSTIRFCDLTTADVDRLIVHWPANPAERQAARSRLQRNARRSHAGAHH